MICKIQPSNPNLEAAIRYNENKTNGKEGIRSEDDKSLEAIEDGHVLVTRNVPEGNTLLEEFNRLRWHARKKNKNAAFFKNLTFHMSVNPSETDRPLAEAEAVMMIDELMASLGYKDQPYRIYKHTDIDRPHYHVVSCRVNSDGRKINSDFERLVLRENLKQLAPKYGYSVILSEEEKLQQKDQGQWTGPATGPTTPERNPATGQEKTEKTCVPSFSRKNGPVIQQMKEIAEDALKWHFSTFEQYQALLLRRYNILAEIERGSEDTLTLAGTDSKGMPITAPLREDDIGLDILDRITAKATKEKMRNRKEQRERLEKLAKAASAKAASYDEFKKLMDKKGVIVVLSFTKDGEAFGVTYLDRATKCAWKGSETSVDLKWLKTAAAEKGWKLTKDTHQAFLESRQGMPSRKAAPDKKTDISQVAETTTERKAPARRTGKLRGYTGPAPVGNRTHGSTATAGDDREERRKDIDDDRPAELVH